MTAALTVVQYNTYCELFSFLPHYPVVQERRANDYEQESLLGVTLYGAGDD